MRECYARASAMASSASDAHLISMTFIQRPFPFVATITAVVVAACSPKTAATPVQPLVQTVEGQVSGRVDAKGVMVFEGIPYAAPPLGALRWQPPKPIDRWTGPRATDRLGKNCMQAQPYGDIDPYAAGISEDCLNLNVWTTSTTGSRPVMVWIHGGGFFAGFGGEERHNGSRLAQKGAVVVTLNYRLGVFGFMAHPALVAESPVHAAGNYGLLDQVAALQWVQRNIARFGGDPKRVTIFGESAGGFSVGALIASPLAKNLFHRAILESGVGTGRFVQPLDSAAAIGVRVASALGVTGSDARALQKLRAASADSVLAASIQVAGGKGNVLHFPVVDGYVLPRTVDSALAMGLANIVPVIVGSNRDESSEAFAAPARAFARLITSKGQRAWMYLFTRVGEDSASQRMGAFHSAEIVFVFGRPRPLQPSHGRTPYDSTLAEAMSDYWVSFANSGDPNGPPNSGKWPRWPQYDRYSDPYLDLGPLILAKTGFRTALYDSLDNVARRRGEVRP